MKKMMVLLVLSIIGQCYGQVDDEKQIRAIYDASLREGKAYDWLNYLSNQIGGRLSGSVEAQLAIDYTKSRLDSLNLDRVWLQPVKVPKWVRGAPEFAYMETSPGITTNLAICALGGSVATPLGGIKANVIEVQGIRTVKRIRQGKNRGQDRVFQQANGPYQDQYFRSLRRSGGPTFFRGFGSCQIRCIGGNSQVDEPQAR